MDLIRPDRAPSLRRAVAPECPQTYYGAARNPCDDFGPAGFGRKSSMKSHMRHVLIDRILADKKEVTFEELMEATKASEPTVKRDLRHMREGARRADRLQPSAQRLLLRHARPVAAAAGRPRKELSNRPARMHDIWYGSDELFVLKTTLEQLAELRARTGSAIQEELAR